MNKFVNAQEVFTLNQILDRYILEKQLEDINSHLYINYINVVNDKKIYVSQLFQISDIKCNNIQKSFIYKNFYFVVFDQNKKGKLVLLDKRYKTVYDPKMTNPVLFDPPVFELTKIKINRYTFKINDTDSGNLKDCN
jgi:hypothetical protein